MSDERLRRLERQGAQGDLAAQAGVLRERVRTGALRADRLRLAAAVGDPAAALAVGAVDAAAGSFAAALEVEARAGGSPSVVRRRAERRHARGWCEAVAEAGGTPALVRAAAAVVEAVAADVALREEGRVALGVALRWVEAVEAADARRRAEAWSAPDGSEGEGDPAVAEAATAAISAGDAAALTVQAQVLDADAAVHLTQAASLVAYAAGSTSRGTAAENVRLALERAGSAWSHDDDPAGESDSRTLRPRVREAAARAIAAWALA